MDLLNLLNYQVWLDISPGPFLSGSFRVLTILFTVFLIGALIARRISQFETIDKLKKIAWRRVSSMLFWMGILGMIYLFFVFERVPIFSMRFWFLIWAAGVLVWLGFIVKYIKVDIPQKERELYNRWRFNKYLPKKKKK